MAVELQDLVQSKVGTTKFSNTYNQIRQGILGVRRERKATRVMQVRFSLSIGGILSKFYLCRRPQIHKQQLSGNNRKMSSKRIVGRERARLLRKSFVKLGKLASDANLAFYSDTKGGSKRRREE